MRAPSNPHYGCAHSLQEGGKQLTAGTTSAVFRGAAANVRATMESSSRIVVVVFIVVAGGLGFLLWRNRAAPKPAAVATVAQPVAPPVAPPVLPPARPAIQHPVEAVPEAAKDNALPGPDEADAYIRNLLVDLVGRKAVTSFLNLDGFARRLVATVNNLATDNASASMWPVLPMEGRFIAQGSGESLTIASENERRYAAFVRFVEGIDTARATALYKRLHPLFQRAYEDLGESGYFNDRLVAVIDELLATPDVAEPLKLKRVAVEGSAKSEAAALYLFEDRIHETRPAGQKMMLRMGRANAQRLKAKLADVRSRISTAARR